MKSDPQISFIFSKILFLKLWLNCQNFKIRKFIKTLSIQFLCEQIDLAVQCLCFHRAISYWSVLARTRPFQLSSVPTLPFHSFTLLLSIGRAVTLAGVGKSLFFRCCPVRTVHYVAQLFICGLIYGSSKCQGNQGGKRLGLLFSIFLFKNKL